MRRADAGEAVPLLETVLVVANDRAVLREVETALEEAIYAVMTTITANALVIARAFRPDAIVIDMGDAQSIAISRQLHADPITAAIPQIALLDPLTIEPATLGRLVDEVVPKPINRTQLQGTLTRWMAS